MWRKTLVFLTLFTILVPESALAQTAETSVPVSTENLGPPTEEWLSNDPDIRQLQGIIEELVQRYQMVDRKALQHAILAGDVSTADWLMGFLPGESDALRAQMRELAGLLSAKYPGMEAMGFAGIGGPHVDASSSPNGATCEWFQLSVAIAMCSMSGPFYWPCAYLAICSYCSGDVFDDICI